MSVTKLLNSKFSYGCVYKITNLINGKCYIGQTIQNPENRWKQHIGDSKSPKRSGYFHKAIKKYGANSFSLEILLYCSDQQALNSAEDESIVLHKALKPYGYSLQGSRDKSCVYSKDVITKMSNSHLGQIPWNKGTKGLYSKEYIKALSDAHLGQVPSLYTRSRVSQAHKNKPKSQEQKDKISKSRLGSIHTEETKRMLSLKRGSVRIQRERDGSIKIYDCLYDAVLDGFTKGNVQQAMIGFHGHHRYKGYVWTTVPKEVKNDHQAA